MRNVPYLIQSMTVRDEKGMIGDIVDFDYMGSAEFEFGAIPKAFREAQKLGGKIDWAVTKAVTLNVRNQRHKRYPSKSEPAHAVMHLGFSDPNIDKQAYLKHIEDLINGERGAAHLKESVDFETLHGFDSFPAIKNRAFWDIKNLVWIVFDKDLKAKLTESFALSMAYLGEK